ncbi:hypothetical protein [Mycobacterium sp. ITM-2016-00318]|uniref:hypothetical protein n=1 Tax=Mycobacterium sp. ITM-2016-00318 TaxID=2099693 RepID=UPI00115BA5ED|nr:hypothetical protein [Mycobacterium sp. ITM-2016-00318]WNG93714.1 hypothetical protein C6A82_004405 [Mycobacterium sp. ITM-2016-00318]
MTQPPDGNRPEVDRPKPGNQSLRDELLEGMSGGECLPLGHIDSVVAYDHSTEPLAARQSRVITTIESLLTDGLLVIGDIVGGSEDYVNPWKLSTEDALTRLRELYVTHHDNEVGWNWTTWFALTPEGERVAEKM